MHFTLARDPGQHRAHSGVDAIRTKANSTETFWIPAGKSYGFAHSAMGVQWNAFALFSTSHHEHILYGLAITVSTLSPCSVLAPPIPQTLLCHAGGSAGHTFPGWLFWPSLTVSTCEAGTHSASSMSAVPAEYRGRVHLVRGTCLVIVTESCMSGCQVGFPER